MILGALSDALAPLLGDFLRHANHDEPHGQFRLFAQQYPHLFGLCLTLR